MGKTDLDWMLLDARQQACPIPLLMLKKSLKLHLHQQAFLLKSTDPHSVNDIQQFCQVQQLNLLEYQHIDDEWHFFIQR